jgi:hypothetical protein
MTFGGTQVFERDCRPVVLGTRTRAAITSSADFMACSLTTTNGSSAPTTRGATTKNGTSCAASTRQSGRTGGFSRSAWGQGAESEQLIRRGALWSGLDLTNESVERVRARLSLRGLPHEDLRQGSALRIPWPDSHFDVVFSHGVLHHVPDVKTAQAEIRRVLRPGGPWWPCCTRVGH